VTVLFTDVTTFENEEGWFFELGNDFSDFLKLLVSKPKRLNPLACVSNPTETATNSNRLNQPR
jgi:hypothetical protein